MALCCKVEGAATPHRAFGGDKWGQAIYSLSTGHEGFTLMLSFEYLQTAAEEFEEESKEQGPKHFPLGDAPEEQRQESEPHENAPLERDLPELPERSSWGYESHRSFLTSYWSNWWGGKNRPSKGDRRRDISKHRPS